MELKGEAKLLRIFLGEDDKALHEVVVKEARAAGLAGATVWKGVLGFGATSWARHHREGTGAEIPAPEERGSKVGSGQTVKYIHAFKDCLLARRE